MSRRIGEDYEAFSKFLQGYNLCSFTQQQTSVYKTMHKKLYGLLIFVSEFNMQNVHPENTPFLMEMLSDLLISLFCAVQGLYKPAKLQLRCSIENFLKALTMLEAPFVTEEKSVYAVFDTAKIDKHFSSPLSSKYISALQNDYSILCRTVHGDPSAMHPTSALSLLPQYDEASLQELATLYIRTIEANLGIFYLNYPSVVDTMHPENKKDFLDCISKSTKGEIIKVLFG